MKIEHVIETFTNENVHFMFDIRDAIEYMNKNYMTPIHLDTLARVSCTCKSTLQRNFHAATGTSPMQYLKHLRMNLAACMLANENKSIVEISIDVGYNSISSFNRHFLSEFKITPSMWRRQMRAKLPHPLPLRHFYHIPITPDDRTHDMELVGQN